MSSRSETKTGEKKEGKEEDDKEKEGFDVEKKKPVKGGVTDSVSVSYDEKGLLRFPLVYDNLRMF